MVEIKLGQNKGAKLEEGSVYLLSMKDEKLLDKFMENNPQLFSKKIHTFIDYSFDKNPLSFLNIYFISFYCVFKKYGFTRKESKKALEVMKYYVRKELERRHDSEAQIKLVLKTYALRKNACGLWNTARWILWLVLSDLKNQIIVSPLIDILGQANSCTVYKTLTEMVHDTTKIALVPHRDSNLSENEIQIEKLTEQKFRFLMKLDKNDSLDYRCR